MEKNQNKKSSNYAMDVPPLAADEDGDTMNVRENDRPA
jgi:hypothetical protein